MMANNPKAADNLKPFVKGDKRINRKGKPRSFGELRELAQQIAHEEVKAGDKRLTVIEAIMRSWAQSKDPRLVQAYVAYAYGKPPEKLEGPGEKGEHIIKFDWGDKPSE
jgi:hypothetical protein